MASFLTWIQQVLTFRAVTIVEVDTDKGTNSPGTGERALESLQRQKAPISKDGWIWWQLTSEFLRELLAHANFSSQRAKYSMDFYYHYVASNIGPAPTNGNDGPMWRSFMTDDFTPLEFSWRWGSAHSVPDRRVRFSMEPIGHSAGSASDPWNTSATFALARQMRRSFGDVDLQWFEWLSRDLLARLADDKPIPPSRSSQQASHGLSFLGFEFGEAAPMLKAYLHVPPASLRSSRVPAPSIIYATLEAFAEAQAWNSLRKLLQFLQDEDATRSRLEPFMFAVDCIPERSRLKIYVRSPDTSFASACFLLRAFEPESIDVDHSLAELEDLWQQLFGLPDGFDHNTPLLAQDHETAGMLYYFETRPHSDKVTVKIYLPVKHYGGNDRDTVISLAGFFRHRGGARSRLVDAYLQALESACAHRELQDGRGIHTYVTASIEGDSLDITSYLNPEVYHKGRKGWGGTNSQG